MIEMLDKFLKEARKDAEETSDTTKVMTVEVTVAALTEKCLRKLLGDMRYAQVPSGARAPGLSL